ncbi:MAG: hypothetical protein ACQEXQ_26360 [Bacillota bacterium]
MANLFVVQEVALSGSLFWGRILMFKGKRQSKFYFQADWSKMKLHRLNLSLAKAVLCKMLLQGRKVLHIIHMSMYSYIIMIKLEWRQLFVLGSRTGGDFDEQ